MDKLLYDIVQYYFSAFHVVTRVNTSVQLDNIRKIADGKESNGTGRTKESVE